MTTYLLTRGNEYDIINMLRRANRRCFSLEKLFERKDGKKRVSGVKISSGASRFIRIAFCCASVEKSRLGTAILDKKRQI